ncbi:MAG: cysteine desulfurase [Gammaproteobacteria bacterium]|nr:cysteine desulfurase [Gammaproteobacteria bacterium]
MLDAKAIKKDFPALNQQVHGKDLVYLDSAASAQKPQAVIDAIVEVYRKDYSNVHRGVHTLSERATRHFEAARETISRFIGAQDSREIIFVRGTTEAINLVAHSYGRHCIKKDDEIIISEMEHHSNIIPWQLLCEQTGAILRIIPVTNSGDLDETAFKKLCSSRTKLLAITHVSNAIGTINPIKALIAEAHRHNIPVLIDGAQGIMHQRVDVQDLDCDFYAFSGHKLYGPTGIGVLYGKTKWLEAMPPYQGGGEMINQVSFEKTTYANIPHKFEAGTPDIASVAGLSAACNYIQQVGFEAIHQHENALLHYATEALMTVPELRIIGNPTERAPLLSFTVEHIHAHDLGTILDHAGVAIRTGHHCAMPLMKRYGLAATARASLAIYNTQHDIDVLVEGLHKARGIFKR